MLKISLSGGEPLLLRVNNSEEVIEPWVVRKILESLLYFASRILKITSLDRVLDIYQDLFVCLRSRISNMCPCLRR